MQREKKMIPQSFVLRRWILSRSYTLMNGNGKTYGMIQERRKQQRKVWNDLSIWNMCWNMHNRWWLMTVVSMKRSWSGRLCERTSRKDYRRVHQRYNNLGLRWNIHNGLKMHNISSG